MDVKVAARVFHDWAVGEGLMTESVVAPSSTDAELALVSPITDDGNVALRHKRIQHVAFDEENGQVVVFTKLTAPSSKKALAAVPTQVGEIEVVYRQGSHTQVGDPPVTPFGGPPYSIRQAAGSDRYACGSSISVGNFREAGTLGCLVRDTNGVLFGMSNNHVSGACSCAERGLPIVAPGIADVSAQSIPPFTLGFHHRTLPMLIGSPTVVSISQNTDVAVFKIRDEGLVTSFQGAAYDTPGTTTPITAGMVVEKVGRTTGHTTGTVIAELFGPTPVPYAAPVYGFSGQIFFEKVFVVRGDTDAFSTNGDSGSLVTTLSPDGTRQGVALVFAGMNDNKAPGGSLSLVLPLEPMLRELGLTLVSGHNV